MTILVPKNLLVLTIRYVTGGFVTELNEQGNVRKVHREGATRHLL
jgi:hypothetical protein